MKKFIVFVMMAAMAVLVLNSCKETLPKRFDSFVNHVEKNASSFSEEDWTKANEKFEKMVDEYQQNRSSYNADEQKQINAAIGKYVGIVAKSGIGEVVNAINGFLNGIPNIFESIGGFFQGLGLEDEPTE